MAKYSFRMDSTFTKVLSTLIIIKYMGVRNTTLVWRTALDMGEGESFMQEYLVNVNLLKECHILYSVYFP